MSETLHRRRVVPWVVLVAGLLAAGCSTLSRIEGTELVYRRVTPEIAVYMLRDSPDALLLDLRPAGAIGPSTPELERARHLPLAELAARAAELEPYRDRTFLVYCGGDPECARQGMRTLVENGCAYAVLIDGVLDGAELPAGPAAAELLGAETPAAADPGAANPGGETAIPPPPL